MSDLAGRTALSAAELHDRLRDGDPPTLLDVRNRDEFESWRVPAPDATHVPYVRFLQAEVTGDVDGLVDGLDLREPVVVVCARGETSDHAAALLRDAGVEAVNLADGMEGWARLYVDHSLDAGDVEVLQYERPSSGCLSYLVVAGEEAAVVDPLRAFAERYAEDAEARGATLRYAVDTHVHADHVSGVRAVADLTGAEVVLPAGAEDRGLSFDATLVADGDRIAVGDAALEALHAPGHTPELTAFRVGDAVLTADALFLDSVGRPDLLDDGEAGARERASALYDTLHDVLLALPDDVLVAPGHVAPDDVPEGGGGFAARLSAVRERVDWLGADRAAFVDRVTGDRPPMPANHERIIAVNLGREAADEEEAFELELGPNNCAV